jgi:hypothetical protein
MHKLAGYIMTALLLLGVSSATAFAQTEAKTFHLKDGSTIQGRIVAQDDSTLVVETPYGTLEIRRENILRQELAKQLPAKPKASEAQTIYLKDGTTIKGTIVAQTESTQVAQTEYGTLRIKRSNIVKQENAVLPISRQPERRHETIQLKDGTVIQGIITQQTADTLEVESMYGIIKIPRSDVKRSGKRVVPVREQQEQSVQPTTVVVEDSYHALEIIGGVGIPIGEFASTSALSGEKAGFASIGGSVGLRYRGEAAKGFELGMAEIFGYYPMNQSEYAKYFPSQVRVDAGAWYIFWTMGTVGFSLPLPPSARFHAGGLLGLLLGVSPSLTATYGSATSDQSASAATAISYGAYVGFTFSRIGIELLYMAGEPEYSLSVSSGGNYLTGKAKQPTATVQLTLGLIVD